MTWSLTKSVVLNRGQKRVITVRTRYIRVIFNNRGNQSFQIMNEKKIAFTMMNAFDPNAERRRKEPIRLEEMRLILQETERICAKLQEEAYTGKEGEWSDKELLIYLLTRGPILMDPNRGGRIDFDDGR